MTTLLEEIRAERQGSGTYCKTGAFIDSIPAASQAAIEEALAERIEASAIARWLVKQGFVGSEESAVRHLRGRCACRRK